MAWPEQLAEVRQARICGRNILRSKGLVPGGKAGRYKMCGVCVRQKRKTPQTLLFEGYRLVRLAGIEPTTPWFVANT
jgi:hypothetical protein